MSECEEFKFGTGTATFAVFDPKLLQHRVNDAADWWSVPWEEVAEINRGNMLTVALGCDGGYTVHFYREPLSERPGLEALIACESGQIYIGAGEQLPAEGLQPSEKYGGRFFRVAPGTYRAHLSRTAHDTLALSLERVDGAPQNHFDDSPAIKSVP